MTSHSKPIVLIDIDGVLVDFNQRFLNALNMKFGTNYVAADYTDYKYGQFTKAQRDFLYSLWDTPNLYDDVKVEQYKLDVLDGLREVVRVVACTSPMDNNVTSKWKFCLRYFDRKDIRITSDKSDQGDVLIDDAPSNIASFNGHAIVYDQPYNQGVKGPRARSFDDIGPLVLDYLISSGALHV